MERGETMNSAHSLGSRCPPLVAVAHGSRDSCYLQDVETLITMVRELRPELPVLTTFLEFSTPLFNDLVESADLQTSEPVVVPLLLSRGFHLENDVEPVAKSANAIVSDPLGPELELIDIMVNELSSATSLRDSPVIFVSAGTKDKDGQADIDLSRTLLEDRLGVEVIAAYSGGSGPSADEVASTLRSSGAEFSICAYLLGRGRFYSSLMKLGAKSVTLPLGSYRSVARLILKRYDQAMLKRSGLTGPPVDYLLSLANYDPTFPANQTDIKYTSLAS